MYIFCWRAKITYHEQILHQLIFLFIHQHLADVRIDIIEENESCGPFGSIIEENESTNQMQFDMTLGQSDDQHEQHATGIHQTYKSYKHPFKIRKNSLIPLTFIKPYLVCLYSNDSDP